MFPSHSFFKIAYSLKPVSASRTLLWMNSVKNRLPCVRMMKRLKTHPDLFFVVLSQRERRKLVKPEISAG